ncbi:MAG: tyrosine--tRNA ligase [Patescibacteria group bacterium]|jgi:tyrosyl-tRNA synthetase|nr:tyrosine--tRNA ligase [Patescibacteria group bacterium]
MSKIITDAKIIDELLNRSVVEILPDKELLRKELLSGRRLSMYIGADPTGSALHLGHATNYIILEKFRKLGHKVYLVFGDFTARIGDPSDKMATRVQLSREDVIANTKDWQRQLSPIISFDDPVNPVEIVYNHDWLSALSFEELIDIASTFTVQRMLERDMFEKRLKENKPIYVHEFFYPLMQGYDSVHLEVDIEMCGNDQRFNALCGRTLLKKYKNKEKFVFITTLLENPKTGEKMMSKSLGTGVFLDASNIEMYGQIMAQADENIPQLFTDCTYLDLKEIEEIKSDLKSGQSNPRDIKMKLAWEIVKIYHGEDLAQAAQDNFIKTFQKKEVPDEIPELFLEAGDYSIIDILITGSLVSSKSEARRLIKQGGLKLNGELLLDPEKIINLGSESVLIQKGKRHFLQIKLKL